MFDDRHVLRRLGVFAGGALVLMVLVAVASNAEQFTTPDTRSAAPRDVLPIEASLGGAADDGATPPAEPVELPDWVAIALAVVLGIAFLYLLSRQRFSFRFRRPSMQLARTAVDVTEEEEADAIATFARDLIDELNDGDSPRFAIQRAYAAVETGFGAQELARKPAETPLRYLDRIFGRHAAVQAPLQRLTELFQYARFSDDPVDESMRAGAIESLTEIRDYYKAYAWRKIGSSRSKSAKKAGAAAGKAA
jgi:hypothetical protein